MRPSEHVYMLSHCCLLFSWMEVLLEGLRRHFHSLLFVLACILAAIVPFLVSAPAVTDTGDFPGWPTEFEGKALQSLPLTALEQRFAERFPGRIARFSDGKREIILRWVAEPTRKLHPARDCFRGSGYKVEALPMQVDARGQRWSRFLATRNQESLLVRERISDERGGQWTDVSSWYWSSFWRESAGPWWAVTAAMPPEAGGSYLASYDALPSK